MSLHASSSVSEKDTTDSDELRKTGEPAVEELSDTALLDSDGEGGEGGSVGGWEELQLDYEELMDDTDKLPGRVCQEDEVKVHATWEIEESSGEEGEIKDETDASTPHSQHQHTPKQATPTDPHDNRGSAPSMTESESENAIKEEGKEEEELAEGRQEVSDQEKVPEQVEGAGSDSGIPHRDTRVGPVCRHFLQGKCSWGKDCRFSHDERKLPPHLRPPAHQPRFPPPHFPPLHGPPPDRFMLREGPLHNSGPDFMLQGPGAPHHPLPREGPPLYMSYDPGAGRAGVVSQVAEESEGWYRLRTVAHHWSSDEEAGTPHDVQDLRDKLSSKTAEGSDQRPSPSPDSHEDQRHKGKKKTRKAKREVRSSSSSSAEDLGLKKQRSKGHSVARDDSESISESVEVSSRKTKRKRKHQSSSGEDVGRDHHHDDYMYPPPRHLPAPPHMHLHFPPHRHPPGPPSERFRPPDGLIPGYGPTHLPPHGHFMDPYGPPHLPPRGHYSDHYGPLPYREWHGGMRSPPPRRSIPRSPSPKRERHKRRKHNKGTVSGSSESSPEPSYHHKHHRKKSSEQHHSRTLDRKEKLLKELSVINEVIERKKQKKHSKPSPSPDT